MNVPKLLTVPEVTELLRLKDEKAVLALIHSGKLRAVMPNKRYLIREDDLLAMLDERVGGAA